MIQAPQIPCMFVLIGLLLAACAASPTAPLAAVSTIASQATPTHSLTAGEERVSGGAPMLFVPAGEFTMGATDEQFKNAIAQLKSKCPTCRTEFTNAESPPHPVFLDDFWIDKYEVTNAHYKKCVDMGRCQPPNPTSSETHAAYYGNAQYDNYPVIYISWNDAKTFCDWVGKRLPTDAEWEKAARGPITGSGAGREYPWGGEFDQTRVNSDHVLGDTTPVGKYPQGASPFGVMDMGGNVWEWVADWYDANYYSHSPRDDPQGPASGEYRVLRGGAWGSLTFTTRGSFRFGGTPDEREDYIGFRCATSTV